MGKTPVGRDGRVYRWRWPILIALLSCYWAVGFYPYQWVASATYSPNAARLDASGILRFDAPGIAFGKRSADWIDKVRGGKRFEVDLTVRPQVSTANRVTTIFSVSRSLTERDFAIDQDENGFLVWVRTSGNSSKGKPFFYGRIFGDKGWHNIRVAFMPGLIEIDIDGTRRLTLRQPSISASGWSSSYHVVLGNEQAGNMAWLGAIKKAAVTVGGTVMDYLANGTITIPEKLKVRVGSLQTDWVPFPARITAATLGDWAVNLFGFIPLGVASLLFVRKHAIVAAAVLSVCVSISIEFGQLYIAERTTQTGDILFNVGGGLIGGLIAIWFLKHRTGPKP